MASTEYALGSVRVHHEGLNPETRRYERHEPRASLTVWVGNRTGVVVLVVLLALVAALGGAALGAWLDLGVLR